MALGLELGRCRRPGAPVSSLERTRGLRWFSPTRSIGARIVTLSLGLLLVVQMASYAAIHDSLRDHVRSALPERLALGERVLHNLLAQGANTLADGAHRVAADPGFRSAVNAGNGPLIISMLAQHGSRVGATEAALFGNDFRLIHANRPRAEKELAPITARLAAAAATGGVASEVAVLAGVPHQVVLVPINSPAHIGWLMLGVPLDKHLVSQMRALSALDLTLLTRSSPAEAWAPAVTALPAAAATGLAAASWSPISAPTVAMHPVKLGGDEFGVHPVWLHANAAGQHSADEQSAVLALVSLSISDAVMLPADLQLQLLVITLIGFAVFFVGSLLTARRVAWPLARLTRAAEQLGDGDYATPMRGLMRADEIGQLAHAFEAMRCSIAEQQHQIMKLAYWDPLTHLPNRAQFRETLVAAITAAQADQRAVAVLLLNLDRFKHVNDVLGYRFGDMLLQRVAERLGQQMVRDGDLVARFGGDEFAVLLRDCDEALALTVAQRISRAFNEPLALEEHTVDMGAGIGMACWPAHGLDADGLLKHAEVAMVAAKQRADGPLMYSPSIDAASKQNLSLMTELRHAVEHSELRLFLQPKLALDTGIIAGAEALVRWQHPQRGLVPPNQFIPFAEQTGFIRVMTMWIFEEAARHWLSLFGEGMPLVLSVNLSTRDLLDQDLPKKFEALLLKHQVPAEGFCLEITESAIMDDPSRALATLNRLSALGFKLAIDDFGTGYSSLAYLKRLPVDELKIDQSFVLSMETDADNAKIVRSTIDLAHNMGLRVVAEGVETAAVWDLLRELDCDEAQGFHMGRPMPVSEFRAWSLAWMAKQPARHSAPAFMLH